MPNTTTPDRPLTWTLANEGYIKVTRTDYFGKPYTTWEKKTKGLNYGKLWDSFMGSLQQGIDYSNRIGGAALTLQVERQETLLIIEQNQL